MVDDVDLSAANTRHTLKTKKNIGELQRQELPNVARGSGVQWNGEGVEGTQEIELYLWVVAAWAGMACSGRSTASRGWWRGRYGGGGVPAGLRWVGRGSGRRREVGALGGGDVDGGGARLARWGEQGTAAAPGADR